MLTIQFWNEIQPIFNLYNFWQIKNINRKYVLHIKYILKTKTILSPGLL